MNKDQTEKYEQLLELKHQLAQINLSLNIVGESPATSKGLLAKRSATLDRIKELEAEIEPIRR